MYENGNKHRINIDFPSFNFPKFNKNKNSNKDKSKSLFLIIVEFLIICIFFFVFIFCISRFSTNVNNKKELEETEFNTNITYIKENIIKYYNVKNIPKNNGDSNSLSLNEIIEKEIISKDKIINYASCNKDDSYVTLTKKRDKIYTLKIHIVCDNVEEEETSEIKI